MTYDPDVDPNTWKARIKSLENALKIATETTDAEIEKTKKWQRMYFELLAQTKR